MVKEKKKKKNRKKMNEKLLKIIPVKIGGFLIFIMQIRFLVLQKILGHFLGVTIDPFLTGNLGFLNVCRFYAMLHSIS